MKQKIDWLNHSLEFFVVIVGILLAFQLNKCSENRTKADLIENHLYQIKVECQENKEKLSTSLEKIILQIQNCDSLLLAIKANSGSDKPPKICSFT